VTSLDITRTIDINAPANKVWAALTEPALIAEWFGDTCDFDATPGGTGVFGWKDHRSHVVVEHIDAPKTLVYRWGRVSGADPVPGNSTVVRFDLTEMEGGTRLSLVETGFEDLDNPQAAHDDNTGGWIAELAELVEFVEAL
jgi:uncharacterized protein YndB with AHSA1/START domain